jgi:hypothetical protein
VITSVSASPRRKAFLVGQCAVDRHELTRIHKRGFGYLCLRCSGLLLLLVAACQAGGEIKPDLTTAQTVAQRAQQCREAAARKPEYLVLRAHMPLDGIDQADLRQMSDPRMISSSEIVALTDWSGDMQQCRNQIVDAMSRASLSGYAPIVLAEWDRQDRVVVELSQRKISWGEAVLRLRESRTTLLTGINEETERQSSALTRSAQAERANQTALINAFTRLVPW